MKKTENSWGPLTKRKISWRRVVAILIGSFLCGASLYLFVLPFHMLSGGVSGIAIILYYLLGTPVGLAIGIMNVPLLYAAYRWLSKDFFYSTLAGIIVFMAAVDVTGFLQQHSPTKDIFLASLYGGVFGGLGLGMVFRAGASTGGTDVVGMIAKKRYGMEIGTAAFAVNVVVVACGAFLFGLEIGMYTLISMFVGSTVVDKVIEGFNRRKVLLIISQEREQIAKRILEELGRGATFLQARGAYTSESKDVLMVVISRAQIAHVKRFVDEADQGAFFMVIDTAEVIGRGFKRPGAL